MITFFLKGTDMAASEKVLKRTHIGIFGTTNSGKSTLMNLLTAQDFSIVDDTAGTTADVKVTVMQFHELGPVKLMDTAGIDEERGLGEKKRLKTFRALRECDVVLLVVDPNRSRALDYPEAEILELARNRQVLVLFNRFAGRESDQEFQRSRDQFLAQGKLFSSFPHISGDLSDEQFRRPLVDFICQKCDMAGEKIPLFPKGLSNCYVLLVIPMDEETPKARLLRPQNLALENLIRNYAPVVCYRPDLGAGRFGDAQTVEREKKRYQDLVSHLGSGPEPLQLIITDSQAMDLIGPWTPENIPLTTFSIMMIHQQMDGDIEPLIQGARAIDNLKAGDKVLIVEACNHDRKAEDIGTVQLPKLITQRRGEGIQFEWAFGREFPFEKASEYSLAIHCGGCMVEPQKVNDRVNELISAGVPVTNYGIALTYLKSPELMEKVVAPFIREQ